MAVLSARGTRLNRRGLETRKQVLRAAVEHLATAGPAEASANAVARHAGVTWGTVQHQFGDVDGLWAAVLEHLIGLFETVGDHVPTAPDVRARVAGVVDLLWWALDSPGSLAMINLRASLPRRREQLEETLPLTARAMARWDAEWTALCDRAFRGLEVDGARLMRVRALLPGAIRGVFDEQALSSYLDPEEARRGLIDALAEYLDG